jgi:hypothetical protein
VFFITHLIAKCYFEDVETFVQIEVHRASPFISILVVSPAIKPSDVSLSMTGGANTSPTSKTKRKHLK